MATIERLIRWLEIPINILLWVALVAGFLMMIHVSAEVAGRTFFNRPLHGTTEIVSYWYMVTICYLPWGWLTHNNNHIVAGVFEHIGTARFGYWVEVWVKLVMLVYVGVFGWQTALRAVQQTYAGELQEAAGGFILVWPCRWILPLAALLMGLVLVLRIVRDVGRGYRPDGDGEVRVEGGI